ncbi:MAG: GH25 family lysozyme [Actinomycetota bacterium]
MKTILAITLSALLIFLFVFGFLAYFGYIWFVNPSYDKYPVRGIDVSEHQGDIDWDEVRRAGNTFAFIKATEGMDHKDACFVDNWVDSADAGFVRGAYHFFTFRSPGLEQAKNFIATVPVDGASLSPAIDIEFGGNSKEIPEKEVFQEELKIFLREIEDHYHRRPILYVTYDSYEKYIAGDFWDCIIWIRDLYDVPELSDGRYWSFWQYCPRGRVDGINGYVDLNIFNGNEREFEDMMKQTTDKG